MDDSIADGVMRARARLPSGVGEIFCVECGEEIPEGRRRAMLGARLCVGCQAERDGKAGGGGVNRRGNKDSQLR